MSKLHAVITGVGGYVPDYVLTNDELSTMVDTNDEWIMTRICVKERRILKEEGLGSCYMAKKAVAQLMEKTGVDASTVDGVICATCTPDYRYPSNATQIVEAMHMTKAFAYDLEAACCGFIYAMDTAACMIESGRYQRIVVVGAEKTSSFVDYTDRATCPIFGDGSGAVLVEATEEDLGWQDSILRTDGSGFQYLHLPAGGSVNVPTHATIDNKMHFIHQEGRTVFKYAVNNMSKLTAQIAERNGLNKDNLDWIIPHQANVRIIQAVANTLEMPMEKVLVNIQRYGNTSAASLPLALWDFEKNLKKGDKIILTAFGAGFVFGSAYLKWAYDTKD